MIQSLAISQFKNVSKRTRSISIRREEKKGHPKAELRKGGRRRLLNELDYNSICVKTLNYVLFQEKGIVRHLYLAFLNIIFLMVIKVNIWAQEIFFIFNSLITKFQQNRTLAFNQQDHNFVTGTSSSRTGVAPCSKLEKKYLWIFVWKIIASKCTI